MRPTGGWSKVSLPGLTSSPPVELDIACTLGLEKIAHGMLPTGSKSPNFDAAGPNIYYGCGIWNQTPQTLGTWTLWVRTPFADESCDLPNRVF